MRAARETSAASEKRIVMNELELEVGMSEQSWVDEGGESIWRT